MARLTVLRQRLPEGVLCFRQLVSEMLVEAPRLGPALIRSHAIAPSPRSAHSSAASTRRRPTPVPRAIRRPRVPRSRHAHRIRADTWPAHESIRRRRSGVMRDEQARIRSILDEIVTPADLVLGRGIPELRRQLGNSAASSGRIGRMAMLVTSDISPVLGEDCPALVIAPAAVDLEVSRRQSLAAESQLLDQRLRRRLPG